MIPSPALLTSLMRSRLLVRQARATIGIGERRSRGKGAGMEFIDYREYQPGDDVRHLDPHLHARTGGYFVRQHAVYQQLPITIVVDGSASMNFGTPTKFDFACGLAAAELMLAAVGGDRSPVERTLPTQFVPRPSCTVPVQITKAPVSQISLG